MLSKLTREDILSLEDYEKIRPQKREKILNLKKKRRLLVGPHAVFLFENRETLWWQIHEMLRIEKGGDDQIIDELSAYAPLVPNGSEWVATLMFEIEESKERAKILRQLGHIEKKIHLLFGDYKIQALPTDVEERTDETGKTSAVHFLRFPFTPAEKGLLLEGILDVVLEITHPAYSYCTMISPALLLDLIGDLRK